MLHDFSKAWTTLFSCSSKSRLAWRTQTRLPPPSFSATWWWFRFKVIQQILNTFGDISTFLNNDDMPVATTSKLLEILHDPANCRKLEMEIAITANAMGPFVKATYTLEGDVALVLVAYKRVSMPYSVISTEHYPIMLKAVAQQLIEGNHVNSN